MRIRIEKVRANREALKDKVAELGIEREHAEAIYDAAPDIDTDEVEWLKYYRANQPEMETAGLYLHIERLTEMLSAT